MAIGDPKTATAMKKELAALKKKRDAGDITAFQFRKQSNSIRKKYGGKPTPSNVSKIYTYISTKTPMDALRDSGVLTPSPRSAKARAKAKETSKKTTVSDAQKASSQVRKKSSPVRNGERDISKNKGAAPSKSSAKTWRDFKSVAAARKAGLNYFTGKDGKKKIAITAEQLKKKGMTLREYANSIKGKK